MSNMQLLVDIWQELKPLFATSDRPEAAEAFVNALIDHDVDPHEIKKSFKKDGNIMNALGLHDDLDVLNGYSDDSDEDDTEEPDYDYYDEDDDY